MASLRTLERDGIINAVPRNEIDWLGAVESLKHTLIKRGFDYDKAEELSHAAMVEVYEQNEFISRTRVRLDMFATAYGILHRESVEREAVEPTDHLPLTIEAGRLRIDNRASYETATTQVRNAIAAKRAERKMFDNFGWLITQAIQTVVPEKPVMRYLSELAYSAYGVCQDTTQLPPNTRRVLEIPVDTFDDNPVSDRVLCESVSNQFHDGVPFEIGSRRETIVYLMLSGI